MHTLLPRHPVHLVLAAALAASAGSCGFGSAGVGLSLDDDSNTTTERTPTALDVVTPSGQQTGRVEFELKVTLDSREKATMTRAEYSLEGGLEFRDASPPPL